MNDRKEIQYGCVYGVVFLKIILKIPKNYVNTTLVIELKSLCKCLELLAPSGRASSKSSRAKHDTDLSALNR